MSEKTVNTVTDQAWRQRMEPFLGSTIDRFQYLDDEAAAEWTERRKALFRRGREAGLKSHEGNCTHLYTGDLSPGCQTCTEGTWSCLFVNGRCNRKCFYCPQELHTGKTKTRPPFDGSFAEVFPNPEKYVVFLRSLNYRGMSVSGGEPFLTFDTTREYIEYVRAEMGPDIYIWAYTNGSLYTREQGEALAAAGLQELRFDISANDYDLKWIAEAAETIPSVSVEIPAIPEDQERVLDLLPKLEAIGVSFMNLHQLFTTKNNCESMADRGYTLIRDATSPAPPILESEICALEIMCTALERGIKLPINYCSNAYKLRFQSRGTLKRLADLVTRKGVTPELGTPTEGGMFRQLALQGSSDENMALLKQFDKWRVDEDRYELGGGGSVVYIHPELMLHPALGSRRLSVNYFRYEIQRQTCGCSHEGQPIEGQGQSDDGPQIQRLGPEGHLQLHNEISRLGFQKVFIEKWPLARTLEFICKPGSAAARQRGGIEGFLNQIHHYGKGFEFVNPDFAPYG